MALTQSDIQRLAAPLNQHAVLTPLNAQLALRQAIA